MTVEFFPSADEQSQVWEFIDQIEDKKAQKKILATLEAMETMDFEGLYKAEVLRKIGNDLYEIRIQFRNIAYRILCVIRKAAFWLLHAFIKKSQKTPSRMVNIANARIKDLDLMLPRRMFGSASV